MSAFFKYSLEAVLERREFFGVYAYLAALIVPSHSYRFFEFKVFRHFKGLQILSWHLTPIENEFEVCTRRRVVHRTQRYQQSSGRRRECRCR